MDKLTSAEYQQFCDFLELRTGIRLGPSKQYLVSSRLNKLLKKHQLPSLKVLFEKIQLLANRSLLEEVIDAMTTNETNWFRDVYPFEILASKILPQLGLTAPAKIWCAACSSGQEPYSIKMTLDETANKVGGYRGQVSILATDLSEAILEQAKKGEFDQLSLVRGLSLERKRRYFEPLQNEGEFRFKKEYQQGITFRKLNLKDSFHSIGKFDVIFCRNVLIYFSSELKKEILSKIASSLNPGGYLFLGASETAVGFSDAFDMIRCHPGIVYRLK